LKSDINRIKHNVDNLHEVRFSKEKNKIFTKDFKIFTDSLFTKHKFNKINFSVVVGNPAEMMYDASIDKYCGRVVGTFTNEFKLFDGTLCDVKWYEIIREEYMNTFGIEAKK